MAAAAPLPEQRFLLAVFPGEFSLQCLAVPFGPDAGTVLGRLRRLIGEALDTLSYRERGILEMRLGLGDGHAYTLAETGCVFGLTRERVRQLQATSLQKLRQRAEALRDFLRDLGT